MVSHFTYSDSTRVPQRLLLERNPQFILLLIRRLTTESVTREKIAENPFTTFGIWLLAVWIGRDGIGYVKGMKAMKRGYASGAFKYAIMCFEKR